MIKAAAKMAKLMRYYKAFYVAFIQHNKTKFFKKVEISLIFKGFLMN